MGHIKYHITSGDRFDRLEVVSEVAEGRKGRFRWYECRCDCGTTIERRKDHLCHGKNQSCGCLARELASKRHTTHGHATGNRTAEYDAWAHMLRRCHTPTNPQYDNYGGRGIRVCDKWRKSFQAFFRDMGQRPSPRHSLDRIDNDGNYEPSNCRWATWNTQANNKRTNVSITYNGRTQTLTQWRRELRLPRGILEFRIRNGWSAKDAIEIPIGDRRKTKPHGLAKLAVTDVHTIRERLARGETQRQIACDYGVSRQTIGDIKTGKRWAKW